LKFRDERVNSGVTPRARTWLHRNNTSQRWDQQACGEWGTGCGLADRERCGAARIKLCFVTAGIISRTM